MEKLTSKKEAVLSLLVIAGLAVLQILHSQSGSASTGIGSRINRLEKQMTQIGTSNPFNTFGAKTAIARPSKQDENWFITGGLLYYKPFVGGTQIAYTDTGKRLSYPIHGEAKGMDFDMGLGFRIGIGYNFNRDGWDLNGEYTHFSDGNSTKVSVSGCGSDSITPLRGALCPEIHGESGSGWVATHGKSHFDIDLNTFDIELGRNYFLSHDLSMRPFFGVRAAWIDFEQVTRYCGGPNSTGNFCGASLVSLGRNTLKVFEESYFKGVGAEMGFQSKWFLAKGFSFYADALGSLLYGFFRVEHKESITSSTNRRIDLTANTHKMVPTAHCQGGIAYDFFFDDERQHLGFSLGYDGQYYWRANQMIKIDDAGPIKYERWSEDFSLHGLAIQARWDF